MTFSGKRHTPETRAVISAKAKRAAQFRRSQIDARIAVIMTDRPDSLSDDELLDLIARQEHAERMAKHLAKLLASGRRFD